jgi:hypothetical protein
MLPSFAASQAQHLTAAVDWVFQECIVGHDGREHTTVELASVRRPLYSPPMSSRLSEVFNIVRIVLQFIGGTTVIGFFGWWYKRRQEKFEDRVLIMSENSENRQRLRTAEGIHSDYIRECLKDVPMWVILPPQPKGWTRFKWRIRTVPYQLRHLWRRSFFLPNLKKVEKTVLHLWKRGLLIRDNAQPKYYRLKP